MKQLVIVIALATTLGLFAVHPASAGQYVVRPEDPATDVTRLRTLATLSPQDFLQSLPDFGDVYFEPGSIVGDDYTQHPGVNIFFSDGFVIGLFWRPIDTTLPGANLFLWETTGAPADSHGDPGPEIQLGIWDPISGFEGAGDVLAASYYSTGLNVFPPNRAPQEYEVTSSITPLSAFYNDPRFDNDPRIVNAVRISFNRGGHNQVTAVASGVGVFTVIPEPSSFLLGATGFLGLVAWAWSHKKSMWSQTTRVL